MASKRRVRRRACTKKFKHDSLNDAQRHANGLGPNFEPYKCRFGNHYHVGRHSKQGLSGHRSIRTSYPQF